jgi:hypothetical protein
VYLHQGPLSCPDTELAWTGVAFLWLPILITLQPAIR